MKGKKMVGLKFILNPSQSKNYEYYTEWLKEPLVMRGMNIAEPMSETVQKKWFRQGMTSLSTVRFEIVEKSTKKVIGFCMIYDLDAVVNSAKVAVFIGDPVYRFRGYGSEVLNLLCKYALYELKIHSLWCEVPSYNSAGLSIFRKQGFTEVGTRHHAGKIGDEYYNLVIFEMINQSF